MEIGNDLPGLKLKNIFVGGLSESEGLITQGFYGCMKVSLIQMISYCWPKALFIT